MYPKPKKETTKEESNVLESGQSSGSGDDVTIATTGFLQVLGVSSIIQPSTKYVFVVGAGGVVALTSNPSIMPGVNGQELVVIGTSDSATLTINDGNGTKMAGNCTLGAYDSISFVYDGFFAHSWIETARSLN